MARNLNSMGILMCGSGQGIFIGSGNANRMVNLNSICAGTPSPPLPDKVRLLNVLSSVKDSAY